MAAAAFSQIFQRQSLSITLIESEELGTVGVGESSIPPIRDFNRLLGINEREFIRETQAIPKLAIKFSNWGKLGDDYFHPFGQMGRDINRVEFHHYWLSLRNSNPNLGSFSSFSIAAEAAEQERFNWPNQDDNFWSGTFNYAYHFDAVLYAGFLKRYAESRGVIRVEGKCVDVTQDPQTGNISKLTLESGQKIEGDFFIDATGFRALLIEKCLNAEYESWQQWLKCDSAIAMPCNAIKPPKAYTHSTAEKSGWRWRIPLQHRVGNGVVYSSHYMSKEEALNTLLTNMESEPLANPRYFSFVPGMRREQWSHNCVAIGLAGGFLEPLESTSIYLIQSAIQKLIEFFPVTANYTASRSEFNLQLTAEFLRIRDFIIMHYAENQRTDSIFWQDCQKMDLPSDLAYRQEMFRQAGIVDPTQYGVYAAVCLGQNMSPQFYDQRVKQLPLEHRAKILFEIKREQQEYIAKFPSLVDWLQSVVANDK